MQRFPKPLPNFAAPECSVSLEQTSITSLKPFFIAFFSLLFLLPKRGSAWAPRRDLCVLVPFRKPKVEKAKANKEAEQQQAQKKRKGFLPDTKKRQKRTKPVLEPAGEKPGPADKPGEEKGRAGTKNNKKTKGKRAAAGEASGAPPTSAKKRKKQADGTAALKSQTGKPVRKKKRARERKGGGGGE